MSDPLVETWGISARINRYLLDSLPAPALAARSPGGRTVGEMFAHLHNVRLMWIKASARDLMSDLQKIERGDAAPATVLARALDASASAIGALVARALATGGKVKGFRPHVHAFVGYLVSHESHHRGQIVLALRLAGMPADRKVAYGLWEWGSR